MADGSTRRCTGPCGLALPLTAFGKDARLKSGVRSVCKVCDRAAVAKRRRGPAPRPGALVLVPKWASPPPPDQPPAAEAPGPASRTRPTAAGGLPTSYADAAEAFIAALEPPAGPADALLVANLRGLAAAADLAADPLRELAARTGIADPTREIVSLTGALVRVQRELAATRMAKAKPAGQPEAPSRPTAANY